jgi:two-component system, NtrC family, response regulator HydG
MELMPTPSPTQLGAPTVLVVDDEPPIVDSLQKIFERESLRVLTAGSGGEALEILRREPVSVLLTDLMMPGMSGMDLLRASKSIAPETETVLMTAYGTVENAVEAMKQGAYDFVTKPIKRAHLVRVVGKAIEKRSLVQENRSLRAQLAAEQRRALIGQSLAWRRTMEIVMQAAPSQATVLLLGESGTGKELLARAIHDSSPRAGGPFVPVNCAALPETILEAELFGYEKGAFTGATQRHDGRFVQADGGTLFLDEIGEIPTHVQVKLLRVLQEGEVERLGGRTLKVDLRLVAATNQDLRAAVREGRFREDLYYRLNVIAVPIPPLRDRRDDIPALGTHFLRKHAARYRKPIAGFDAAAMQMLLSHPWPGNIRELDHAIERAVLLAQGDQIRPADLGLRAGTSAAARLEDLPLEDVEKVLIQKALSRFEGNVSRAAQALGLSRSALYRRIASYGL